MRLGFAAICLIGGLVSMSAAAQSQEMIPSDWVCFQTPRGDRCMPSSWIPEGQKVPEGMKKVPVTKSRLEKAMAA